MLDSAEKLTFLRLMLENEFAHLVDGVNAVQVALALRHSPGEQAVAAENDAFSFRDFPSRPFRSGAPIRIPGAATEPRRSCDRIPC